MTRTETTIIAVMAALTLTACPKPVPDDPVPAGCKPPNHCADEPHTEGPPPIGSNSPPPR